MFANNRIRVATYAAVVLSATLWTASAFGRGRGGHSHHGGHHGHGHYGHGHHGHHGHYGGHHRYGGYSGYGRSYYYPRYSYGYSSSYYYPRYRYGSSYGYSPSYYSGGRYGYSPYSSSYGSYGSTYSPYSSSYRGSTYQAPYSSGAAGGGSTYGGTNGGESLNASANSGWDLLAAGRASDALGVFANAAESNPTHGVPKVGYALSAASAGDLDTGAWAMRRACRIDPKSMQDLQFSAPVGKVVKRLVETYGTRGDRRDGSFMLASLHYLQRDGYKARKAAQAAANAGDRSESLRHLQSMIAKLPDAMREERQSRRTFTPNAEQPREQPTGAPKEASPGGYRHVEPPKPPVSPKSRAPQNGPPKPPIPADPSRPSVDA